MASSFARTLADVDSATLPTGLLVKVFDDSAGSPAAVRAHLDRLLPTLVSCFGLQYRFEVHCRHIGTEQLWPLEELPEDHATRARMRTAADKRGSRVHLTNTLAAQRAAFTVTSAIRCMLL